MCSWLAGWLLVSIAAGYMWSRWATRNIDPGPTEREDLW